MRIEIWTEASDMDASLPSKCIMTIDLPEAPAVGDAVIISEGLRPVIILRREWLMHYRIIKLFTTSDANWEYTEVPHWGRI